MIHVTPAEDRYHFKNDWLSTYWHFSFDHYFDPENVQFGPLRVFNDDVVQPGGGFPTHSHREMEIVTYVLNGRLEHRDSTGGQGVIGPGEVQRMTAGTGIQHSEFNASQEEPVHLLQMWVMPAQPELTPGYEQKRFPFESRKNVLLPVVSGRGHDGALGIHQDVAFHVAELEAGKTLTFEPGHDRRQYLFVISGQLELAGEEFRYGDTARIHGESPLNFVSRQNCHFLLIDLP